MVEIKLLTREEFKKQVFARTHNKCCVPGCTCDAVDAHHIMDRKLYSNGGYYLNNGAALCAKHHLDAEHGVITPLECISYMNNSTENFPVPNKLNLTSEEFYELLNNGQLNKWGE